MFFAKAFVGANKKSPHPVRGESFMLRGTTLFQFGKNRTLIGP
jgi:hypothetical protein